MALLSIPKDSQRTLTWAEVCEIKDKLKDFAIVQFINLYNKHKNVYKDPNELKFGDETEYQVVGTEPGLQDVYGKETSEMDMKLVVNGFDLAKEYEKEHPMKGYDLHEEFGSWMVEVVPSAPYHLDTQGFVSDFLSSFMERRHHLNKTIFEDLEVQAVSLTSVPNLGTPNHYIEYSPDEQEFISVSDDPVDNHEISEVNVASRSLYVLDKEVNKHPRFPQLMKSIRERRGDKVHQYLPVFQDKNTSETQVHLDAMAFGMGLSCLQLTYEAQSLESALFLHDSLLPFGPILAAISAASPIHRGMLTDVDSRWNIIEGSVDMRTDEERDSQSIPHSRYSMSSHYLSDHPFFPSDLNDDKVYPVNEAHVEKLVKAGVSTKLAYHIGHLLVNDPLVVFEKDDVLDENQTNHFESFQSSNWNSMRFKPPPSHDSPIGWRVEFRTLDIQLTDYENAMFSSLVTLIVKMMNAQMLNTAMPISQCHTNMDRSQTRDAVNKQKFWFPTNIDASEVKSAGSQSVGSDEDSTSSDEEIKMNTEEQTMDQIFNGSETSRGLLELCREFIQTQDFTERQVEELEAMLEFFKLRASGKIQTGAQFLRNLVLQSRDYQQDSVVGPEICNEVVEMAACLGMMECEDCWKEELIGPKPDFVTEVEAQQCLTSCGN